MARNRRPSRSVSARAHKVAEQLSVRKFTEETQRIRLGNLYNSVDSLLRVPGHPAQARRELARLASWYGAGNVEWILGVIKEDRGGS